MSELFGSSSNTPKPIIYSGLNVGSSQLSIPIPIFWGQRRLGTNAIWLNGFTKHSQGGKGGGGKGGSGKGSGQYDYTASTIVALCEGPVDSIVRAWGEGSTTTTSSLAQLNQTFFPGSATQSIWSFFYSGDASSYVGQARSYALTAYLASPNMDLGDSATIPDNGYECLRVGVLPFNHTTTNGWIDPNSHTQYPAQDCLMSDIIKDFLTNPQYGMGFVSGDLGDPTLYRTYNLAQGLFFSPLLNSQEKATSIIDRWAQLTNSWIYWSGTQLQYIPLGDQVLTANGVTYTPDDEVAYNLSTDDFLDNVPVKVSRADPADCFNKTTLNYCDRTMGYIDSSVDYRDDPLIDEFKLVDSPGVQGDEICDPQVANIVVELIGRRSAYIRKTYAFKTSYRFIRCLPGTILTLTDENAGLDMEPVRVRTIEGDEKGALSFLCEEYPSTVGVFSGDHSLTVNPATTPNKNATPPSINTPAVLEPLSSFTGGVPKLIIAASGGPLWGGCNVWVSFNNTSYSFAGSISKPAVQGVLTSALASNADPDTTDTLSVDCSQSLSVPVSVTHDDADSLRTVSWVSPQPTLTDGIEVLSAAGEMLSFGNTVSTATYAADLTYLRRGKYGFAPEAHSVGDQFTVMNVLGDDGTSISYILPAEYIGKTIYLKFTSRNLFDNMEQQISDVPAYEYVATGMGYGGGGAGKPSIPTGFTVTATAYGYNTAAWATNPLVDAVLSYTLFRATGGSQPFSSAVAIWTGNSLSYEDSSVTNGTEYSYFLVANNAVGASTSTAGINATALSSSVVTGTSGDIGLTGTIDGTNTTFTMAEAIPEGAIPLLSVNGTYQVITTNYSISGTTLTFVTAPPTGAAIVLSYTIINIPNFSYF